MWSIECVLGTYGQTGLKSGEVKRGEKVFSYVLGLVLRLN